LGNLLDIEVKQPFLDTRIIEVASKIPFALKVREIKTNGEGKVIGKLDSA
jgi:hypothetical protein